MDLLRTGRARMASAAAAACLVSTMGLSLVSAQDSTPTPSPSTEATPETGTGTVPSPEFSGVEEEKAALTEYTQTVTDHISAVQADRDSVTTGDFASVDDLLTKASQLNADAATALGTDDVDTASNLLLAANETARAAEGLLKTQLADFGLPSQQTNASRILAEAFSVVDNQTGNAKDSTDANVTAFIGTAQSLYQTAYDLYNAGTYTQAAGTARAAAEVARIAAILDGQLNISFGGGRGGMGQGGFAVPGNGMGGGEIEIPGNGRGGVHIRIQGGNGNGMPSVNGQMPGAGAGDDATNDDSAASSTTDTPEEVPSPTFN